MSNINKEPSRSEIKELLAKILLRLDKNDEEFDGLKSQVKNNEGSINGANEKVKKLENEVEKLKNIDKAKNIIIYGIPDSKEVNDDLENKIKEILKMVDLRIDNIDYYSRMGKIPGNRPVIIKLTSLTFKQKFFDRIGSLKAKGLNIANDISKEDRELFKKLKVIQSELINFDIECKIIKSNLFIENKQYNLNDATKFLEETKNKIDNNIRNDNINNEELNEINESINISSAPMSSKKRERQESKSPEESKEKKISKILNKNQNLSKHNNSITNYYSAKTSNQTITGVSIISN